MISVLKRAYFLFLVLAFGAVNTVPAQALQTATLNLGKNLQAPQTISLPCPGLEDAGIYPVPNANKVFVCPDPLDAKIIFVSASDGADSNDGLSADTPLKTISEAKDLLRDELADWVVLKRGDVWDENIGNWRSNGKDILNPDVYTAYGDISQPRPLVKKGVGYSAYDPRAEVYHDFVLSGLEFTVPPLATNNANGVRALGNGRNISIHDNKFSGFKTNVVIQATCRDSSTDEEPDPLGSCENRPIETRSYENVLFLNNTLNDAANDSGHSQGAFFASKTFKLHVEGNAVIDNGYLELDDNSEAPPTTFNQGLYIQYNSDPATVINNSIIGNAAAGMQMRSNGIAMNNLFSQNSSQLVMASKSAEGFRDFKGLVKNNLLIEGRDMTAQTPGALAKVGIYHRGGYAHYTGNVIALMKKFVEGSICNTAYLGDHCQLDMQQNLFSNPDITELNGPGLGINAMKLALSNTVIDRPEYEKTILKNNVFHVPNADDTYITYTNDDEPRTNHKVIYNVIGRYADIMERDALDISANIYLNPSYDTHDRLFKSTDGFFSMQEWRGTDLEGTNDAPFEPHAIGWTSNGLFDDTCRSIGTYVDDVLHGNQHDNCAILQDQALNDALLEEFKDGVKSLSRFSSAEDKEKFSADAVNNYVRAGFGLEPVPAVGTRTQVSIKHNRSNNTQQQPAGGKQSLPARR